MAVFYLVLALLIQCSFIHADIDVTEDQDVLRETLIQPDVEDGLKEPVPLPTWFNMYMMPNNSSPFLFPTSSASMMAQLITTNKTIEEQLHDIKELAKQISEMLENEMVNLFSDVISKEKEMTEKETDGNGIRKRRSVETPLDSSKMVMRLLKHIKNNNEYQNIAIEKMMTAQEIAEKYGIEFNPDPEILSELAVAANEHAQEMTNMLKDACSLKNITVEKVDFVPIEDEPRTDGKQYFSYATEQSEPSFEYMPDVISRPKPESHIHEPHASVPVHHHHTSPVSPKPSFYDSFMYPYSPASDFYGTYTMEPVLIIPIEEDPEPELVGEVVEETVTSKMIVEKGDEAGCTSINHVTTYTVSEKSLYKQPQIQQLPQHFQYCFYLM